MSVSVCVSTSMQYPWWAEATSAPLSVCLSVYICLCLSVSVHLCSIHGELKLHQPLCLSVYICLCLSVSVHLCSIRGELKLHQPLCLSICLFVYVSLCLCLSVSVHPWWAEATSAALSVCLCMSVCVSTSMQYPWWAEVTSAPLSLAKHRSQLLHLFGRLFSGQQRTSRRVWFNTSHWTARVRLLVLLQCLCWGHALKKLSPETGTKNLTQVHHSFLHQNNSPANHVAWSVPRTGQFLRWNRALFYCVPEICTRLTDTRASFL